MHTNENYKEFKFLSSRNQFKIFSKEYAIDISL